MCSCMQLCVGFYFVQVLCIFNLDNIYSAVQDFGITQFVRKAIVLLWLSQLETRQAHF